ncbi:MAG TPA: glycine oxidase ThiO [Gemmatimonadaceae bacterium]|nr:glycine oxidase ThiO [Gemmatimonadaceae bacterium]
MVGGGIIGLATAWACTRRGLEVTLVSESRHGEASAAAAGMLAPTVEPLSGPALEFAIAGRERYPEWLRDLALRTGSPVELNRSGILEIAHSASRADSLRANASARLRWLDPDEAMALEPALAPCLGGLLHPLDGAVDNVALMGALQQLIAGEQRVGRVTGTVRGLDRPGSSSASVTLATGTRIRASHVVLAAGAWAPRIAGLPRLLPVEPARGQMIALEAIALRHVVYCHDAYLVPRTDGRTLVGATMEYVGFDSATTPGALARLHRAGAVIVPALAEARIGAGWAGLRPMTPDALPIVGRDPDWPALIYACGHSRNGILMAPVTGESVAALIAGDEAPADLSAFSITRFG